MLASITPLGERSRGSDWTLTSTTYVMAALAGGAAIGMLAGGLGSQLFGSVPTRPRLALVAAVLVLGLGWEAAGRSVPGPRRQVDERWLDHYRGWVYGAGFGVQIGTGVTTVVVSSAVYGVLAAAFASASVEVGLAIGAVAGALRGATVLSTVGVQSPQRLLQFHEGMRRLQDPVRRAGLIAQLALAGLIALAVAI